MSSDWSPEMPGDRYGCLFFVFLVVSMLVILWLAGIRPWCGWQCVPQTEKAAAEQIAPSDTAAVQ